MNISDPSPHISVVSPIFGCPDALPILVDRLHSSISSITTSYEIILVNDASPDNSWELIVSLSKQDSRIKGINLSRNFGQHHAISAGLDFAQGDWVVVMDCDLQDSPEEIVKLYNKAISGFDVVVGLRVNRRDSWIKVLMSKIFFRIISFLIGEKINPQIGNFGIYSQRVIHSIRNLREKNRSFGFFALWVGFRRAEINIVHNARSFGHSSYSFSKMINLAFSTITAHSNTLLNIVVKLGFIVSIISLFTAMWIIIRYLAWGLTVVGWTSLIVSIYFTAGLIIATIGIVGIYIGKIFDEVKNRPIYIIEETTFLLETSKK